MKEQLISFETAKLAKEKGFPKKPLIFKKVGISIHGEEIYKIYVTQSLLQKWLREVHSIQINLIKLKSSFMFFVFKEKTSFTASQKGFNSFEEALEKGLQEALKLI